MKNRILTIKTSVVVFMLLFIVMVNNNTLAQNALPYLGQTPPGNIPVRLVPDSLAANAEWQYHGTPSFSPDGTEMYYAIYRFDPGRVEIWFTEYVNGAWTTSQKAPFSNDSYTNNNPTFSRNKDTLYFFSTRPGGFIFRVTRANGSWSSPVALNLPLPSGYYTGLQFSIADNGNLYTELSIPGSEEDIYLWRFVNGQYQSPELLSAICSPELDFTPYIDPAERFIMFSSRRPGGFGNTDIYISKRNSDKTWTSPVNLGQSINSGDVISPVISRDGNYFFFDAWMPNALGGNPYWVDAQVIYNMIPKTPYLGQTAPGLTPEIFAPGIVSTPETNEWSCTFSPDSSEMYFYRIAENGYCTLFCTKFVNGGWTDPEEVDFSSGYTALEPHLTLDNHRLYFAWNVGSAEVSGMQGGNYFVERTASGWSAPVYAGDGMWLSSDLTGQMYTTDMSSAFTTGNVYLAKITTDEGVFTGYERISMQPNYGSQAHPCISPDGSYMLFDVEGGEHLFVSFKKPDGTWSTAIDLVDHGFNLQAGGAYISPDGKYLFFHLNGDIWWVDADVIKNLNPFVGIGETKEKQMNNGVLFQNEPNPCNSETTISFQLKESSIITLVLYNQAGTKIAEIIKDKTYIKGKHEVRFDVSKLSAGIYNYTLLLDNKEAFTKKIMVIK